MIHDINAQNLAEYATWGNARNTYTGDEDAVRIDYLMHWATPGLRISTSDFVMPQFNVTLSNGDVVSLSDHQAQLVEYTIENGAPNNGFAQYN